MRRPNGSGSIIRLSGKRRRPYAVRIFDGIELKPDGNGKQKYKYIGYFEKQSEALQFLEKYNTSPVTLVKQSEEDKKHLFSEIYELYISELKQRPKKLSDQSYASRNSAYNNLKPLHNMVFENITLEDLENATMKLINMSGSSVKMVQIILKGMYKTAMRHKFVTEDLSALMIVGHSDEIKRPHIPFTESEINLLWEHKDEYYPRLFLILIYTGMRVNELLEMRSENVHLDERYMIGGLKTKAGINRTIPISEKIAPLLDTSNEYLITLDGKPLNYRTAVRQSTDALKSLNLTHNFHDTRHTCSTLLERVNIPILHRKLILGHSLTDVTDRYTHVDVKDLIEDINKI